MYELVSTFPYIPNKVSISLCHSRQQAGGGGGGGRDRQTDRQTDNC